MDISRAKDILDYWFSKGLYTADYDKWFMKSQDYDEEIKEKFGDLLKEAEQGKGFGWLHTKDSYVAYIILLDQFSRHIYRGKSDAFKNDDGCMIFVELGWDIYEEKLEGYEFMFAFMPYMHTESINYQEKGEEIFNENFDVAKDNNEEVDMYVGTHDIHKEYEMMVSMKPHVEGHSQTIQKFGRFPKRNADLGRISTEEEIRYMEDPEVQKRPY